MTRVPRGAADRLVPLLAGVLAWADTLDTAQLELPTPRGVRAGVLIEGLRERARATGDAARAELATLADLDALAAVLPGAPPAPRASVAAAVRATLADLTARHPGHLVEVRVPPWGAVQIGRPGVASVHRRGTPPNVVETDPATWLRLAWGVLTWEDALAAHTVSASGAHAELGDLLPLA